jgi:lipid II:glycine glycyltransferase (peptidoglycan interpeptide bridge formation enzyme)
LGVFDQGELKAFALVLKMPLLFGKSYLYCPRGPVLNTDGYVFYALINNVREIARSENSVVFRVEQWSDLQNNGTRKAPEVQRKSNWVLDLNHSKEEILAGMKQKTRYNIRLAQKKGVTVSVSDDLDHLDQFFVLAQETAERNEIKTHPKEYYKKMIDVLAKSEMVKFYVAEYKKKVLAINLILTFGKTITYLHGGSTSEHRNVMAPYLLHWQAIQDAKENGIKHYDFGGVSPQNEPNHKWAGISRFKIGFGGYQIETPGTFDREFNSKWYRLYQLARKIRRSL